MNRWAVALCALTMPFTAVAGPPGSSGGEDHTHFEKMDQPIMPFFTQRSGYCCVTYHSDPNGKLVDAEIVYCSDPVFGPSAELAMSEWVVKEEDRDWMAPGKLKDMSIIHYFLNDELGQCIEDSNGLTCDGEGGFVKRPLEELCRAQWVS